MNLCIDEGNSKTKLAVCNGDKLLESFVFDNCDIHTIKKLIDKFEISNCILSSVKLIDNDLVKYLSSVTKFILLTHSTPLPIINKYKTPESLGKDRLAAVVAATVLQPNTDLLVIDAGTAITYDFVDANKIYHGGNIAPGIDMRFRALHEFTSKLPLVVVDESAEFLGNSTTTAISSGVIEGVIFEIEGYINTLKIKYPELSTFLTGGSTFYIDTKLKSLIFVEKYLVLKGLNSILNYNVQN